VYEDTFSAAQDKAQLIPLNSFTRLALNGFLSHLKEYNIVYEKVNNLRKKMKYVKCVTGKIGFKTA